MHKYFRTVIIALLNFRISVIKKGEDYHLEIVAHKSRNSESPACMVIDSYIPVAAMKKVNLLKKIKNGNDNVLKILKRGLQHCLDNFQK